ncbi:MAG: hypothetical protein IPL32_09835 [Chloracidobacterium sp.]|nr:hypothetical protein [Chloracidobacterium sp.]
MNTKTKIYIGIALVAIIAIFAGAIWQPHKITRLERVVSDAKQTASEKQDQAAAKEIEAAEYKQKIEFLEQQLADIQTNTRKQDEKLEKATNSSRNARGGVERAKRTRAGQANTAELCAKLAEIGHSCE